MINCGERKKRSFVMIIVPLNNYQIIGMVNVEKIANTFLFPVGDQGWSSQNAYQKSKQESP